jgi:hypothetical protein
MLAMLNISTGHRSALDRVGGATWANNNRTGGEGQFTPVSFGTEAGPLLNPLSTTLT